jgi:phosphoenolpyruvate synthase/pyruvate phosphate dikinase
LKETRDKCVNAQGRVLTDLQARSLARTALNIKRIFGGKDEQDIEYGFIKGQLYVVQARPYIDK